MKKRYSFFKNPEKDILYFREWVNRLEKANGYEYEDIQITTSLGKTQVWGLRSEEPDLETLVIFPGFRTSALFWDFDRCLESLKERYRIFMVETNGQPNLSDGYSPDIRSLDYGNWACEVLDQLSLNRTYIAGASFGGLVCMKLCITNPEKVQAAFLLNPGCFRMISLGFKNLFYNLLPVLHPRRRNVEKFLDTVVLCSPDHSVSQQAYDLITDFELFVIKQYKDNTEKPYNMGRQLQRVKVDTYMLVGDQDILLPYQKSVSNAQAQLGSYLKEVIVFKNVGHGIETFGKAMQEINRIIKTRSGEESGVAYPVI